MHLLKFTAVTLMVMEASVANAQSAPYLTGNNLRNAISNYTLIGQNWAEFYQTDGNIAGRARKDGRVCNYTGTWTARPDRICYSYPAQHGEPAHSGCSKLKLNNNTITHFDPTFGWQKFDGVATRYFGNALDRFSQPDCPPPPRR
ncbi:hypothetical protein C7B82_06125 [Stenomitos frigidus ULC18]|uniref:Uncharacterized protein n=1 Tax=Stenomitos frigidus ULC18 TaxID=2107698 RepID=A0A2T1EH12_9CYAN|nr:hypothetical protein C7B82_06125 [Stenomitos frigidus ULC18]